MFNRSGYRYWLVGGMTVGLSACGVGLDTDQASPIQIDPIVDPGHFKSSINNFRVTDSSSSFLGYLVSHQVDHMILLSPNDYFYALGSNGSVVNPRLPSEARTTLFSDNGCATPAQAIGIVPGTQVMANWVFTLNSTLFRPDPALVVGVS